MREELATAVRARILTACTPRGRNRVSDFYLTAFPPGKREALTGNAANKGGPEGGTPVPLTLTQIPKVTSTVTSGMGVSVKKAVGIRMKQAEQGQEKVQEQPF